MASLQEPEVQFAQRLASNERPVRTKAIKKLRKYIGVRSLKGAFTADELLKLWKGLFYCLWMQDKPLLQEELSRQISSLIHSFHGTDGQFLYMETFLQTIKREWNGIDRLRMDKFFQLVRFMFRQTFEMLKRSDWESSVVSRFLDLLTLQLLQSSSDAPSGLQFHVLDVYMAELAGVASTQLTADQNLTLIEPFCKTAVKTKDRVLLGAICSSIFRNIVDQAPFAIRDLMKEIKEGGASESDSGQASEEEEEEDKEEEKKTVHVHQGPRTAGTATKPASGGGKEDEDDDDYDELQHLEDLDSEELSDEDSDDVGPVLQFDYACLASRLLELAGRTGTPSHNRQKLYRIIKVLRDLSEGIFPQSECPEEVSTDEDDDMFGSRKRIKRKRRNEKDEEEPTSKKTKGKKKDSSAGQKKTDAVKDNQEAEEKKKKKKKKKKTQQQLGGGAEASQQKVVVSSDKQTEAQTQIAEGQSEAPPPSNAAAMNPESNAGKKKRKKQKKRRKKKKKIGEKGKSKPAAEPQVPHAAEIPPEDSGQEVALEEQAPPTTAGRKNKKSKKNLADGEDRAAAGSEPVAEETTSPPVELEEQQVDDAPTAPIPKKKSKKTRTKKSPVEEEKAEPESLLQDTATTAPPAETETMPAGGAVDLQVGATETPMKKKRKIPIEFEYEADEVAAVNGSGGGARRSSRKSSSSSASDFVSFQSGAAAPTPLFCRGPAGGSMPLDNRKSLRRRAQSVDSKKVTFGLTNNRTAEFRKSDRSLLLSPDGSSRVPFDPLQKPKCGVLKSPELSKNSRASPAPKRRPTAVDFF